MSAERRATICLATGVFCIGWSAIFVTLAHVPGLASAFYRTFFALLVLLPWWLARKPARPVPRRNLADAVTGALFFALDLALWNAAILATSATTATLLANNAPVWVGLITVFVFRERLPARFWLGITIALCGTALIVGPDALNSVTLGHGHLMALAAGFFYALFLLSTHRIRSVADTRSFMTVSVLVSATALLALCLVFRIPLWGYPCRSWAALLALGLVSHLGGWLAINYALGHMRAPIVAASLLAQAVVTAVLSMLVLGDRLDLHHAAGGVLVLGGVSLVNRGGTGAKRG